MAKLIEGLGSSDLWVQGLAISGLSQSRDPRAIGVLKQTLFHGTGWYKWVAAALANQLGSEDLPDIIQAVQKPGLCEETAMGLQMILRSTGLGPTLTPMLQARLSDTTSPRKDLILQLLVDADREAGREAMTWLVSHSDDKVRERMASCLRYYAAEQVQYLLPTLMNDTAWKVREWVALSMGAWGARGDARIFGLLLPLLADTSRRVRASAARMLAQIGGEKALPYLQKLETERRLLGRPLKVAMQAAIRKKD